MPRNAQLRACLSGATGPKVLRSFVLRGATGQIRTATFQEREHIVVPIVALMEGVIHAVNAAAPELVLADELAKAPGGWNGRPVMMNHPQIAGAYVSANDPTVLETWNFGTLFNTRVANRQLLTEAWLDPARAAAVGPTAERVIERANAGEPIEISVGNWMMLEVASGVHNGAAYEGIWRDIVPDHLAMLEEGHIGACSNEMGCGTVRASRAAAAFPIHVVTARGFELATARSTKEPPMHRSLRARFLALVSAVKGAATDDDTFRARSLEGADDVSDVELRGKLHDALRAIEPGFLWVEEVIPAKQTVIFAVEPERQLLWFQRRYEMAEDGTVSINTGGEREQVERSDPQWKVVAAAAPEAPKATGCGCGGAAHATTATSGGAMKTKAERIAALIASKKNTFTTAHQAYLEGQTDEQLTAIEDIEATLEEPKAPAAAPTGDAANPTGGTPATAAAAPEKEPTEEEYLAKAPKSIRDMVAREKARDAARKTAILASLKGKQDVYTDAELAAMDVEQLDKIARVAGATVDEPTGAINYAGQGTPRTATSDDKVEPAPSLVAALSAGGDKK